MEVVCEAYHILSPDSLLVNSVDLQPGRGQRSVSLKSYLPMIIPIVTLSPGVSTSLLVRETICELSNVLKSSYSPAQIFLCTGPFSNWATMIASTFCKMRLGRYDDSSRQGKTCFPVVLRRNRNHTAHCIFKSYRFLKPRVSQFGRMSRCFHVSNEAHYLHIRPPNPANEIY